MPLPEDYLVYPHRANGFDNPHFEWEPVTERTPVCLKDGTISIATIIVPLEYFPLDPPTGPFKHPGAMQTPYPDLRHYTVRDYGNRVGVYRLMEIFRAEEVKVTFAINAEIARRYPPLIDFIQEEGHEIAGHGVSTACIHHEGLSEIDEEIIIRDVRETFPNAVSWMSPARNESYRSLDLLSKHGFSINLDWEADIHPLKLKTTNGHITALPNYNELSDSKILSRQTEEVWIDQITESANYSLEMYDKEGSSAFAFTLTPYISGQPFRIWAVREIISYLRNIDGLEIKTARDSVETFLRSQE